jgi:nudix-type nucleoside diphosphatase (YffH/AdpP family)
MSEIPHGQRPRRVQIEQERTLLDSFFRVEEAVLRYERYDGRMSKPVRRVKLERGDSVALVLRHLDSGQILLVEQFKYPTYGRGDGWIVETVAGMVDEGESAEEAARREVREEIGYDLCNLQPIATFYVSPGGTSECVTLFYGEVSESTRVGAGGGLAAEGEDIQLCTLEPERAWRALDAGEIIDAKTMIGLMWLRNQSVGG